MAIHHATAKKANEQGVTLHEEQGTEKPFVDAIDTKTNKPLVVGLEGEKAADVLSDALAMRRIQREFSELKPDRTQGKDWYIDFNDQGFTDVRLENVLEQVLEHAEENGLDIANEEAEEEEQESGGSVVAAKYRQRYREAGDPNSCGDWLATQLAEYCAAEEGFDLDFFKAICDANEVDYSTLKVGTKPSDKGRFRMSAGLKLRRRVFETTVLIIPATGDQDDTELSPPKAELARWATRYKYRTAKEPNGKKAAARRAK
jgi:hypothetical protein